MLYRPKSCQRVRVWAWTPSVPLTTSTAQSSTGITRSASGAKSAWPGVSTSTSSRPA